MMGVHCMCHHTNLVVQTLSKMDIVGKIKDVLQSLYFYLFHSPKKIQKSIKLVDMMEIKGQQIFKFIKMHWISMLFTTKTILSKYYALVLKMHQDVGLSHKLPIIYKLKVMLGFFCIMPMFERLNELIKFSQF